MDCGPNPSCKAIRSGLQMWSFGSIGGRGFSHAMVGSSESSACSLCCEGEVVGAAVAVAEEAES